jgi:hypothetical protein
MTTVGDRVESEEQRQPKRDIRRHRVFCSDCQTLRDDREGVTGPHSQLMLSWTDPQTPSVSVYVCRTCKNVLIRNLADDVHRWK